MSNETAKQLADKFEALGERIGDLAQYLEVERIIAESSQGPIQDHSLLRLGVIIGWINDEGREIVQDTWKLADCLKEAGLSGAELAAAVEAKLLTVPNGDVITTPERSQCSAAYLVELGQRLRRRWNNCIEVGGMLMDTARNLRG